METTIWPSTNFCLIDLTVEAVCSNGTDRITIGARVVASSLASPSTSAFGTCSRTFSAAAVARSSLREPITTGRLALANRSASPSP